jgi:hypothetical protein
MELQAGHIASGPGVTVFGLSPARGGHQTMKRSISI